MDAPRPEPPLVFGRAVLDVQRRELSCDGTPRHLRAKSFDVLSYLARHPGRVVGKDELIRAVWGGAAVTDDSIVQCLVDIRRALEPGQDVIRTIRGRGYRFDAEVRPAHVSADGDGRPALPAGAPTRAERLESAVPVARSRPGTGRVRWILAAGAVLSLGASGLWVLAGQAPGAAAPSVATPGGTPAVAPQVTLNAEVEQLVAAGEQALRSRSQVDLHRARVAFESAVRADPRYAPARAGLANVLTLFSVFGLERPEVVLPTAAAEARRAVELDPTYGLGWAALAHTQVQWAREVLRALQAHSAHHDVPPVELAYLHLGLGERDAALSLLEQALQARSRWMELIAVEPILEPLRAEPRFIALLRAMGLPDRP